MKHTTILSVVTFVYFASFVFYLFRTAFGKEFWGRIGTITAWAGIVMQAAALIWRWKESYDLGIGHIPLSNLYESMIFFAWAIVLFYLVIERKTQNRTIGTFVVPLAFLIMAYASISPGVNSAIQPLIPALQSNWLTSHVVTCFMGYAGFTFAFGCALIYFMKSGKQAGGESDQGFLNRLPSADSLDELINRTTALGFVFLTIGIMTGSVWAHYAWGSYWSWDPKETWSLITWLIYAVMLHSRYVRDWRGRRTAIMSVIGFASMLFTYLGVNLLPGLHSYLK